MRCRLAIPAALAVFTLCTATGCRLGGSSGMTSWLPGQTSTLAGEEELAEAPRFEGEVVKPSTAATPYPTTSTPQGYVVPESGEAAASPQMAAIAPAVEVPTASVNRTPPVTYGMKPAEVQTVSGMNAAGGTPASASVAQVAGDSIAPQEGPYAPLAPTGPAATTMPPPDTVVSGFAAAGGTSAGPYPPEATVGLAPAASEASAFPPPAANREPAASAIGSSAVAGGAFPRQPAAEPPAVGGTSSFAETAPLAAAGPTVSAFGQQSTFPEGGVSESPVAGARYASAGSSRFGATPGFEPPPAATPPDGPLMPPPGVDLQAAPATPRASLSPSEVSAYAPPVEAPQTNFEGIDPAAGSVGFGSQVPSQPNQRPGRRADPMYRPAGTSSYEPAKPIFSDEPEQDSRVQMATFEEPVAMPFQQ